MKTFSPEFTSCVANKLRNLIREAHPKKPYAAVLYAVPHGKDIESDGIVIASGYNTEMTSGNPSAHAETNVLNMAAKSLFDAHRRSDKLVDFYLFVSTRPCPKCTAAIVDSEILDVYFLYENDFEPDISAKIIEPHRHAKHLTFSLLPSLLQAGIKAFEDFAELSQPKEAEGVWRLLDGLLMHNSGADIGCPETQAGLGH